MKKLYILLIYLTITRMLLVYADCPTVTDIKNRESSNFVKDKYGTKWVPIDQVDIQEKIKSGIKFFYAAGLGVDFNDDDDPLPSLVLYHFECAYTTKSLIPEKINDRTHNLVLIASPSIAAYEINNPRLMRVGQGSWALNKKSTRPLYKGLGEYFCFSVPSDNDVKACPFDWAPDQRGHHLYGGADKDNDLKTDSFL